MEELRLHRRARPDVLRLVEALVLALLLVNEELGWTETAVVDATGVPAPCLSLMERDGWIERVGAQRRWRIAADRLAIVRAKLANEKLDILLIRRRRAAARAASAASNYPPDSDECAQLTLIADLLKADA
jgi:hypothetical protein